MQRIANPCTPVRFRPQPPKIEMKLTVIGTGYVGLVTGACFAETGKHVTCLDTDEQRIDSLRNGKIPFFEPGLSEIVKRNIKEKRLEFTNSYENISEESVFFLCVGTPDRGDGKPDLADITSLLDSLSKNLEGKNFIFTKSTVPLGTNKLIQDYLDKKIEKSVKVIVSSTPEFLKEGNAVNDFMKPDRIIVGSSDLEAIDIISDLYKPFNWSENRLIVMTRESAELTKYAANSFLATKISFMNEIAKICDITGANIHEVREGIGADKRIGKSFLYAGLGFGGSCFPKDVRALIRTQKDLGIKSELLPKTIAVNENQIDYFLNKIQENFGTELKKKVLTIWGLSFKPNTDDIRESLAIKLIYKLSPLVKSLVLYDPESMELAKLKIKTLKNIEYKSDKYKALDGSNGLIIATEWKEFWDPDIQSMKVLRDKIIFDGRNILNKSKFVDEGFTYIGLGV